MKKIGTLNARLSGIIAAMGHSDKLVICDSGLPIPKDREVVDLALTANIPRFLDTLRVILEELHIEGAIIASEMIEQSGQVYREVVEMLPGVEITHVPHETFKRLTSENGNGNVAFVRTGEATSYANIILISGVTF